jgi:hypothetical protein
LLVVAVDFFLNFGAQSNSNRPPICPIWEISVNVRGLDLSQSPVFWTSSSGSIHVRPSTDPNVKGVSDCEILCYDITVISWWVFSTKSCFFICNKLSAL